MRIKGEQERGEEATKKGVCVVTLSAFDVIPELLDKAPHPCNQHALRHNACK
jgi:hypothetical protein